jgi:hypothetical protein
MKKNSTEPIFNETHTHTNELRDVPVFLARACLPAGPTPFRFSKFCSKHEINLNFERMWRSFVPVIITLPRCTSAVVFFFLLRQRRGTAGFGELQ